MICLVNLTQYRVTDRQTKCYKSIAIVLLESTR